MRSVHYMYFEKEIITFTESERLKWDMCKFNVLPEFGTHIYYYINDFIEIGRYINHLIIFKSIGF